MFGRKGANEEREPVEHIVRGCRCCNRPGGGEPPIAAPSVGPATPPPRLQRETTSRRLVRERMRGREKKATHTSIPREELRGLPPAERRAEDDEDGEAGMLRLEAPAQAAGGQGRKGDGLRRDRIGDEGKGKGENEDRPAANEHRSRDRPAAAGRCTLGDVRAAFCRRRGRRAREDPRRRGQLSERGPLTREKKTRRAGSDRAPDRGRSRRRSNGLQRAGGSGTRSLTRNHLLFTSPKQKAGGRPEQRETNWPGSPKLDGGDWSAGATAGAFRGPWRSPGSRRASSAPWEACSALRRLRRRRRETSQNGAREKNQFGDGGDGDWVPRPTA